jgi:hypothetical protein
MSFVLGFSGRCRYQFVNNDESQNMNRLSSFGVVL